jgi:hypothetical protein
VSVEIISSPITFFAEVAGEWPHAFVELVDVAPEAVQF